jgi:hypothetical protein
MPNIPTPEELTTIAAEMEAFMADLDSIIATAKTAPVVPAPRQFPEPAPRPVVDRMPGLLSAKLPPTKSQPIPATVLFIQTTPGHGVLTIRQKRLDTGYSLTEFRADGGRGFQLEKLDKGSDADESTYEVFLADPAVQDAGFAYSSCSCKGFERFGHCKHVDAVQAVADRGWNVRQPAAMKPANTAQDLANDAAYRM